MLKAELDGAVALHFFMPSPALAPYISTYYLTEVNLAAGEAVEDWLHPEWANLRFTHASDWQTRVGDGPLEPMPKMILTGPTCRAAHFRIGGTARIWGIGLLPLGWARLVHAPASDFVDRVVDAASEPAAGQFVPLLGEVLAGPRDPAAEALRIDGFLLRLLDQHPPHDDEQRIRAAHTALIDDDMSSVGELAERLGMSTRSLERLSLRAFGFPPKLLLRRPQSKRCTGPKFVSITACQA